MYKVRRKLDAQAGTAARGGGRARVRRPVRRAAPRGAVAVACACRVHMWPGSALDPNRASLSRHFIFRPGIPCVDPSKFEYEYTLCALRYSRRY